MEGNNITELTARTVCDAFIYVFELSVLELGELEFLFAYSRWVLVLISTVTKQVISRRSRVSGQPWGLPC